MNCVVSVGTEFLEVAATLTDEEDRAKAAAPKLSKLVDALHPNIGGWSSVRKAPLLEL